MLQPTIYIPSRLTELLIKPLFPTLATAGNRRPVSTDCGRLGPRVLRD
jgi:hypothetical protein